MSALTGYPRWQGELSRSPRLVAIAMNEVRRAWSDQTARSALIIAFASGIIWLGQLYLLEQSRPGTHGVDALLGLLGLLRWAAVAIAAVMAGVALLEDDKRGALELYMSRSVTRWTYLGGKILAVLGLTFASIFIPALIYYLGAFVVFETQPEGWAWTILGALGYAAIWAIVASGVGLGVSCLVRSTRAATIILLGGLVGLAILLGDGLTLGGIIQVESVLSAITGGDTPRLFSPTSMLRSQTEWLFQVDAPYEWPWSWGLIGLGALALLGWATVWLRHPRLKGVP